MEAGFVQGFAREGIGLQIHCIMPIIQASPQPPTARRPLPKVSPQLVADCKAANPRFGQGRLPGALAQSLPANPQPGSVQPDNGPVPAYGGRGQTAPDHEAQTPSRPTAQTVPEQGALVSALPPEDRPETGPAKPLPPQFRRVTIEYGSKEPAGTIVIDTAHTYLYLVLGNGKAMRYGVGVGREGFTWNGAEKVYEPSPGREIPNREGSKRPRRYRHGGRPDERGGPAPAAGGADRGRGGG